MALETASYIADLVATNPLSSDQVGQGDDHLRLLKSVLQATFPNLGNQYARIASCSAGITLAATDNTALVNVPVATAGTITHTVSLPAIASVTAGFYVDLHIPGPTDVVILDPDGAGTIEGSATLTIGPQAFARAFSDGTTWRCVVMPSFAPGADSLALPGALTVASTLSVSGNAVLHGALSLSGAATLGSTLSVSGAAVLLGMLQVGGTTSFSSTVVMDNLLDLQNGQIKFPTSQNASADANTLDDYEEGTWTPALTAATPGDINSTYTTQSASYTKIGRVVVANFHIVTSATNHTTAAGGVQITGLPFTAGRNSEGALRIGHFDLDFANYASAVCTLSGSSATISISKPGLNGNSVGEVLITEHTSGQAVVLIGQISYSI